MRVGYGANGHRTNMRLPFSLTKYMRFSVFILFIFIGSGCCCCFFFFRFSNIYFHLVDVRVAHRCCSSTNSCRCTFIRFVRARHSITCCFVHFFSLYPHTILWIFFSLPLNIVLFLFLCFQRAITFRLIRLLCLVQFTFIIEFSAHMRGGSDGACIDFLSTK